MPNRLLDEVSPYLLAHAENPVDWHPWGGIAFTQARSTGKPVLLSIGYSACHWCHVMAHESFEHAETAALMNELFVNIKVDREERPDVDHVYMSALQSLGQHGGWPLTMFLDADGKPFWGGTYFPRESRYGQPSFRQVLTSVSEAYRNRRSDVDSNGRAVLAALTTRPADDDGTLSLALLDRLALRIRDLHDPENGGLKGAPKFPNPAVLEFLWRAADRTGDESLRGPMQLTLERMARGGIHDHVGGGFSRYSVDASWLIPHFEKMLYDNAQLLPLLALAAQRTGSEHLTHAADRLVAWLLRDMRTAEGAFASALDADSLDSTGHLEEGAYYSWTPQEIRAVLGARADLWCAAFDITRDGNFEGRAVPNLLSRKGPDRPESALDAATEALRQARESRHPPARDDKVLADWNGLMIAGLARSGMLLGRADWIAPAVAAFNAVIKHLGNESILAHAWRNDRRVHPGFASDHAAMGLAALALGEATGDRHYLAFAEGWAATLLSDYALPDSGIIAMTVATADDLPFRPAPTQDDAVPNSNAMAAELFVRLSGLTGEERWLTAADDLFAAVTPAALTNPFGHAALLNALDLRLRRIDVVTVEAQDAALASAVLTVPFTNRTLCRLSPGESLPKGLSVPASQPTPFALVCANGRCSLPACDAPSLLRRIDEAGADWPGNDQS